MPAPAGQKNTEPKIGSTLWSDLHSGNLKNTFVQDMREIYHFYITRERKNRLREMGKFKRAFFVGFWILKGLFYKLTPLRRLMLVLSIYLAFQDARYHIGDTQIEINLKLLGFSILLLILLFELKDKTLARDELAAGRAVQSGLNPECCPEIPGWEIFLYTRPANDVGGDLIDSQKLGGSKWSLSIGDVAGKGLGAAMLMARMIATLRALNPLFPSLKEISEKVNDIFCRDGLSSRFISLICLHIEEKSGNLEYVNCGHMPPLILGEGGVKELKKGDPAIGLSSETTYRVTHLELNSGDWFIAYSDGVTEAVNKKDEFFGYERLAAFLDTVWSMPAAEAGQKLIRKVDSFTGSGKMHDDLSFIFCRKR